MDTRPSGRARINQVCLFQAHLSVLAGAHECNSCSLQGGCRVHEVDREMIDHG